MAEWDIEVIIFRAARDYADQFNYSGGSEAYEADLARAKEEIAAVLAEHDREVAARAAADRDDYWRGRIEPYWQAEDTRMLDRASADDRPSWRHDDRSTHAGEQCIDTDGCQRTSAGTGGAE